MYSILSGVKGAEPGLQSGLQGRGHLSSAGITAGQWTLLLTLAQASDWSGGITWPGYWPLISHSGATTDIQTSRQKASVHKIQFLTPCSFFDCNCLCVYKTWLFFLRGRRGPYAIWVMLRMLVMNLLKCYLKFLMMIFLLFYGSFYVICILT